MITIQNGKFFVPEDERFIGFAGDNLRKKIEFLVLGETQEVSTYRLYLTFDDDSVNFFVLPKASTSEGVLLTWDILESHIFKAGIVKAQIKAFAEDGMIWHTNAETFIVGKTAEYPETPDSPINTEFLEYEKALNRIRDEIKEERVLLPYIGDNGNWYCFDAERNTYVDSGKTSKGQAQTGDIAENAVTTQKLANGVVTKEKLADWAVTSNKIADRSVTAEKLADGAVSTRHIAAESIMEQHIEPFSIQEQHIVSKAVSGRVLADGAVTTEKLADGAVTAEKLSNSLKTEIANMVINQLDSEIMGVLGGDDNA
ncbi:MAG: hypothetical protein PUA85_00580 [Oscillospiraceae bacterium]|nr:hypothetical protein [Oscillospiraceae bacterium]